MPFMLHPKLGTTLAAALACVSIAGWGCARQPTESPVEHTVQKVPSEAAADGTKAEPDTKEEFERALSMKLERLDEELRELQARLASLAEAAKAEWTARMAELEEKRKAAGERLDEVRKSAEGAWEHLREGADRAGKELDQAVQKAREQF